MGEEKPLKQMADAFKELTNSISQFPEGEEARIDLGPFSHACSLVSPLFRCLGIAFRFAELDYVAKVNDLTEASKSISMVPVMMDDDIKSDCVRKAGSHTRNLLRVKRGIDMVKVLFEHIISSQGNSLKDPASKAYAQVFAPYHGWAIRKAVGAGMYALPTKAQLLNKLNEDETSARIQMQNYISSAAPVVKYIEQLFISRGLGTDW
ncbi:Glycolipid transfer protein family protein [Perilla frutescens var. hirtella]|uniref:Glycolipid transfer protein family protein n=1 Tax=Perilla frutescens var. hirtella TaxID=608512 RepID=A0AAD4IT91_PERFH|nr:Glycolipid transfer protein family protein [Perilla frutescens var. frutescens]KAH6820927.1 Glycolipid transfer protein family protein [Perilla frutescens var. hirtella]